MWGRIDGLRVLELGMPGEQRTWLTDLVLSGAKTATAGLLELDYVAEGEPLEHVGERLVLLDDEGSRAALLEVAGVEQVAFGAVSWEFAQAEGEGFRSIEHWREVHGRYWAGLGQEVTDSSTIVCLTFRLLTP
ncbi:ASCH domain-containing protein [Nonomuraea sp. NEAU-A123]|uniref:ASCH domain-containing protein n=1 Tax=Nonomuraea sp. NEAU-A123 TaxID=2839649 RepID=UPI001BE45B15|nr:ASCH domain-containing protein [Nonomuraea sp. NEAU-A123]MBT2234046.1 ASCH domain-containing protein [Nonomuraea sp. NEAU-A123]